MPDARLIVDRTHLDRRASGIERITAELFCAEALHPLPSAGYALRGRGRAAMVAAQALGIPAAMAARPADVWLFSGFPPTPLASLWRERAVLYVHDLFLITRPEDLNRAGRLYLAPSFRTALRRLRYFLANSATTAANLAPYVGHDAEIRTYRPEVRDVFGLAGHHAAREPGAPLVLGAVGTVEPRKNFRAAAEIAAALGAALGRPVEFHVVGRPGWGGDAAALARMPHVRLHGFLPDAEVRRRVARFDALVCTSRDEGLGLPLLEAQYAGLQVVAPDGAVFREVLGASGLYVDPGDAPGAAAAIAARLAQPNWRDRAAREAGANIARWNASAKADKAEVTRFLSERLRRAGGRRSGPDVALGPEARRPEPHDETAQHVGDLQG